MNVDAPTSKDSPVRRNKLTLQRSSSYVAIGFGLAACVIAVVAVVAGMPGLGYIPVGTAVAMASVAITMLAIASVITLTTLRRTLTLVSHHEHAIAAQARLQAFFVTRKQRQTESHHTILAHETSGGMARSGPVEAAYAIHGQTEAERRRVRIGPRSPRFATDPFDHGQIHPVREVEGIGDHYGGRLDGLGITDTKRLWNANASSVASALTTSTEHVENWQCMAELMAVDGIVPQYAELLVRAGIPSIRALCAETPQSLLDRIIRLEQRQGSRIQGKTIGIKAVEGWIQAARPHGAGVRAQPSGQSPKAGV